VRVAGIDVRREPVEVRKVIGLSGQYAAVDEHLTGLREPRHGRSAVPARPARSRGRARELLERFDLADAGDRPVKTYSGGMRRRLDLAAALVAEPQVLFLDEPTTGLDPRSRTGMWEVIRELVGGGTTLLLTTQYLEEADRLADDIVVIDHGRVIAQGTADALKARSAASASSSSSPRRRPRAGPGAPRLRRRRGPRRRAHPHADRAGRGGPARSWGRCDPRRRRCRGPRRRAAPPDARRRLPDPDRHTPPRPTVSTDLDTPGRGGRPMSVLTPPPRAAPSAVTAALADGAVVAKRNLIKIKRVPEILVWTLMSPIMFVLLFAYVFGGSIDDPGHGLPRVPPARDLRPDGRVRGDLHRRRPGRGHAEGRHRPVPLAADVALGGADRPHRQRRRLQPAVDRDDGPVRPLVGWRVRTSLLEAVAGILLLLLFAYALSWVMAWWA
jgi:ABC-type Na+ transport system ATPase subunit NatA